MKKTIITSVFAVVLFAAFPGTVSVWADAGAKGCLHSDGKAAGCSSSANAKKTGDGDDSSAKKTKTGDGDDSSARYLAIIGDGDNSRPKSTPEPSSLGMLAVGLVGVAALGFFGRKKLANQSK